MSDRNNRLWLYKFILALRPAPLGVALKHLLGIKRRVLVSFPYFPSLRATEGAKHRGEQYEVGAAWRAKQPGHSAVEPLWASAVPRRGALDRRVAEAGRAKRDPETLCRDRVRERDLKSGRASRGPAHTGFQGAAIMLPSSAQAEC